MTENKAISRAIEKAIIKPLEDKLKSLESENKKLKEENRKLFLDNAELNKTKSNLINRITTLEAENEAYKGMWKEFKKGYSRDGVYFYHDCSDDNDEYVNDVIRELEQKYLGGGE